MAEDIPAGLPAGGGGGSAGAAVATMDDSRTTCGGGNSNTAAQTNHSPPPPSKTHHLLKHQLPEGDVSHHFGTSDLKAITKIVNKMGQRELQAKFRDVFETPTFSNNNNWLRRKLMEAAGIQSPRLQQKAKKGSRRSIGSPKKKSSTVKKALFRATGGAAPRAPKRDSGKQHAAASSVEWSATASSERRRSARQRAKAIDVHLVWAKLHGHGWWPAQVVDPATVYTMDQPPTSGDYVLVQFIEEGSHAWALQSEALDMLNNWKYLANSNSSPAFQTAVRVAHQMLCAQTHQHPQQLEQQQHSVCAPPSAAPTHVGEAQEVDSSGIVNFDSIRYGGHPSTTIHHHHQQQQQQQHGHDGHHSATPHCSPSDFSHESTDDVLAPSHLNHFCESLLLPGDAVQDSDLWNGIMCQVLSPSNLEHIGAKLNVPAEPMAGHAKQHQDMMQSMANAGNQLPAAPMPVSPSFLL